MSAWELVGDGHASTVAAAWHAGCGSNRMETLNRTLVRYPRLARMAWLAFVVLLAACQEGDDGGGIY